MSSSPTSNKKQRVDSLATNAVGSAALTDGATCGVGKEDDSESPQLELLSAWFCPYAQRAWIAMGEICPGKFKVTEAMETVPPDDHYEKIPLLLEANPNGLVPVIVNRKDVRDGNLSPTIVYESLICVEYVDEALGESAGTLLPGTPKKRAYARMWADKLNKRVCTVFYTLLMKQTKEEQEKAAKTILEALRDFSKHCCGPFFFGEEFTIVDIALAPWAVGIRMDVLNHYRNFEVPKTKEYEKYFEWVDAVSKRPSFKATACEDKDAMVRVYKRYAQGSALSKVGDAVRGGTALP